MIFGKRISALESQMNELVKQYATLSAECDKFSSQIHGLEFLRKVQNDKYDELSYQITDLKERQKAQYELLCELREEVEKLKRGMK